MRSYHEAIISTPKDHSKSFQKVYLNYISENKNFVIWNMGKTLLIA